MSDTARQRGRLLASAVLAPERMRTPRTVERAPVVGEPVTSTRTGQPRWRDAETYNDQHHNPRCGQCRRRLQHRSQHRCPWLSCRAWFKGWGDVR